MAEKKQRTDVVVRAHGRLSTLPTALISLALQYSDVMDIMRLMQTCKLPPGFVLNIHRLYATDRDGGPLIREPMACATVRVWDLAVDHLQSLYIRQSHSDNFTSEWRQLLERSKVLREVDIEASGAYPIDQALIGLAHCPSTQLTSIDVSCETSAFSHFPDALTPMTRDVLKTLTQRHGDRLRRLVIGVPWADVLTFEDDEVPQWTAQQSLNVMSSLRLGHALEILLLRIPAATAVLELLAKTSPNLKSLELSGTSARELWTGADIGRFMAAVPTLTNLCVDGASAHVGDYITFTWDQHVDKEWWMLQTPQEHPHEVGRLSGIQRRQCDGAVFDVRGGKWDWVQWVVDNPLRLLDVLEQRKSQWSTTNLHINIVRGHGLFTNWSIDDIKALWRDHLPSSIDKVMIDLSWNEGDTVEYVKSTQTLGFSGSSARVRNRWQAAVADSVRRILVTNSDAKTQILEKRRDHVPCPKLESITTWYWTMHERSYDHAGDPQSVLNLLRDSPALHSIECGDLIFPYGSLALWRPHAQRITNLSLYQVGPVRLDELSTWTQLRTLQLMTNEDTAPHMTHERLHALVVTLPNLTHFGLCILGSETETLGQSLGGRSWLPDNNRLTHLELHLPVTQLHAPDVVVTFAASPQLTHVRLLLMPAQPVPLMHELMDVAATTADAALERLVREAKLPDVLLSIEISTSSLSTSACKGKWSDTTFRQQWLPFLQVPPSVSSSSSLTSRIDSGPRVGVTTSPTIRRRTKAQLDTQTTIDRLVDCIQRGKPIDLRTSTSRFRWTAKGATYSGPLPRHKWPTWFQSVVEKQQ